MAEARTRRHWSWRLADLVPEEDKYGTAWKWASTIGPYITIEGKECTVGFSFYLFAFCVWYRAKAWDCHSRFTGLEIFWLPTQWLPTRLQPGDCIFQHRRRIGRYYHGEE